MDFDLSGRSEQWRKKLQAFFDAEVLPRHRAWLAHVADNAETPPFMADLQDKARAAGLWNLGLPELADDEPGTRLSNLEYAPLAEIMGRLFWAPEVFNCQAPDVPNMIALQNCATPAQKARWLQPLLEAKTRSAFGMTEPDVASSDATNIATKIVRDGGDYVINGRKWFITGAAHPQCSFLIVMGVTDADADRTSRHSCIIVPMDAPGVRLVRRLRWMGCEDHVAPIGELTFDNVRVPAENLLGAEGEGFQVAQVRLGPARIHHCMRSIGLCELLIELMMVRASERSDLRPHRDPVRHRAALDRRSRASSSNRRGCSLTVARGCLTGPAITAPGATCRCSRSRCPRCCRGSPTAPCRCSARWADRTIRRSIRRWRGEGCCASAMAPMKCICGRSFAWSRCRNGRSPTHHILLRIRLEQC